MSDSVKFDNPVAESIRIMLEESRTPSTLSCLLALQLSGGPDSVRDVIRFCFSRTHQTIAFRTPILPAVSALYLGYGDVWPSALYKSVSMPKKFFGFRDESLRDYGTGFLHHAVANLFQSATMHDSCGSMGCAGLPDMIPQLVLLEEWAELYPKGIPAFGSTDNALGNSIKAWARDAGRNGPAHLEERKRGIDQSLALLQRRLFPESGEPPVLTAFGEQTLRLLLFARFGSLSGGDLLRRTSGFASPSA